jgi:peptidyl-prolyl cis-trans isomerase D
MRNNLKSLSWTLWLVILAFIGFIFVQWGAGRFDSEGLDRDVAAVGRSTIGGEEFQKSLARTLEMYRNQFKDNFSPQMIDQLRIAEQVLQGMISGRIVQGEAQKLRLQVSDAELQNAIRSQSSFQRDGHFIGSEEYERLLAYNHVTVVEFEESLRQDILADKLKELVTAGLVLDGDPLREDFRKENDKAELDYIAFRLAEVKEEPVTSAAELREFYAKNPALFQGDEKRAGEVLALKFADLKKEITLKEDELFAYYKGNKAMFKLPGKTKVSRIWVAYDEKTREEVLKRMEENSATLTPDNFAARARELSGDDKAKEGGDWGYWGWQSFSAQEKSLIGNLKQGGISSPVDAGNAFSLLYVPEKIEEQQESYDAVKARIRGVLENERLRKLAGEKMAQAQPRIKKAESLSAGAGKLGVKVVDSGPLTRGQAIKGLDEMGYISQKLFAMKENEISEPVEFPEGIAMVRLVRVDKPQTEPFDAVRQKVATELGNARKLQLLEARALRAAAELNRLADAKKVEEYLGKEGLKAESATYQRGDRLADLPVTTGLDEAVFALEENIYSAPLALKTAVVIVRLKSKKVVSDEDFAKEREAYYGKRLEEAKNTRFGSYLLSKKDDYKIRFNAEMFEKVKDSVISRFR